MNFKIALVFDSMDDMWFLVSPIRQLRKSCLLFFIYSDVERKFRVVHRLISLSFRINQLSELARQSDNRVRVRRSGALSAYFARADRSRTSQNAPSTHNRDDSR
jgi:hypothetical protein